MLSLVMIPRVPSPPMNKCFKSQPVLSLWISEVRSKISPVGNTASSPRMWERKEPYLTTYLPPALVDAFPPTWHEPLAPRSRGVQSPYGSRNSLSFSKITPAWHVTTEATSFIFSILFMFCRLRIIQSKTGTLPPTKPVLPPCGTTASLLSLQCFRIFETSSVLWGHSRSLDSPLSSLLQQRLCGSSLSGSSMMALGDKIDLKYCRSLSQRRAKSFLQKLRCQKNHLGWCRSLLITI